MVVDSQEIVNAINASGSAVVELERNAVNVEILGIQSPKSSTVVTIHVNHFPEVINVYVVVTGPSDDLMSPRGMTRNFKVSGTSSKRVDDGDGPPVDVPLQSFSSEVSDFDNSVQHTMAPTFAVLSQALLRINDAEVAELVRQYTSGQKTAKMFGMDFWAILNNIENVMGVKKVATLGDIPHGSYLVCYGELPDFPSIQSKRLTCLLINPDIENQFIVCQQKNHVLLTISGAACGRSQSNFVCMCFGPTVMQPYGDIKTAIKLSAAFSAVTDGKGDINDIYAVDGYI